LEPFADAEVADGFFAVFPEYRGGGFKVVEDVVAFGEFFVLGGPGGEVVGEGDDVDVAAAGEELFGLFAFRAVFE